jgi:hypothetical protein
LCGVLLWYSIIVKIEASSGQEVHNDLVCLIHSLLDPLIF